MKYVFLGKHIRDTADGRMIAPGETVDLSDSEASHPHNADMISRGELVPAPRKEKGADEAPASGEGGIQ